MGRQAGSSKLLAALVVLVAVVAGAVDAAKILVVMPMPARSHHIAVSGLTQALAAKGHHITFCTALPEGNKINPTHNHKLVYLGDPYQNLIKAELKSFWEQKRDNFEQMLFLMNWGADVVNRTMTNPAFLEEINKPGQKYDLIILEAFFFQEGFMGLAQQFNAPVVAVNPFGTSPMINEIMGNPVNPSWVPSPFLGFSDRMSFIERTTNTLMHVFMHFAYNYYYLPKQQALMDLYWPDAQPIDTLLRTKIALTLINNHFSLAYPSPMSPNIVEIGGIQISEKRKPLPKDLQEYLDSAKEGVVYFSMGSNLKLEHAPENKREAIISALGKLKQKVLLKWDGPTPKNMARNIRVIEWAPQSDLLAHPNIRAFITHGGLLSTQESVYHGVPVVGIPMFGDQQFNMRLTQNKGLGLTVEFGTLTEEKLSAALNEVLGNPKFKQAASRLSALFRSKPLRPADAAVFAVEHVLAHGGDHMRPASVGMPLYQLLLLDVLVAVLVPILGVLLVCRAACRALCGSKNKTSKRKKNN